MAIKWTKDDVIKKFQQAMTPEQAKTGQPGQRPNVLQNLVDKTKLMIKGKPGEGEEGV